jgi:hypothetical protein
MPDFGADFYGPDNFDPTLEWASSPGIPGLLIQSLWAFCHTILLLQIVIIQPQK